MLPWRSNEYLRLQEEDNTETWREKATQRRGRYGPLSFRGLGWAVVTVLVLVLILTAGNGVIKRTESHKSSCTAPAIRKEWRNVSQEEQAAYIAAALCLHETPSSLDWDPNARRSDDFPWLHAHNPVDHHRTPNFLPWHRYFIHLYEKALKEECGYQGHLLYWDWTLDWQILPEAPVFDVRHGFGGDGGPNKKESLFGGSCIVDGPFSSYEVRVLGEENKPHCLSRGFGRFFDGPFVGNSVTPDSMKAVHLANDYYDFMTGLEGTADNDIPLGMGGDWVLPSAPNDPLFFLHHTQVDRLWWLWQHEDPGQRVMQYTGPRAERASRSLVLPSLDEHLPPPLGLIGDGLKIRDLMSTVNGMFCYGY